MIKDKEQEQSIFFFEKQGEQKFMFCILWSVLYQIYRRRQVIT